MIRTSFNAGWEFREKENAFAEFGQGASGFEPVTLPHDAMIGRDRDPGTPAGAASGYFPGGVYEYRKTFHVPESDRGRRIVVEFEGVYRGAAVFLNGAFAGQRPSGYARFFVDADPFLRYGQDNEIRVEARTQEDSRWYSGAGIHRGTWLLVGERLHIGLDGVRVTTPDVESGRALVAVATTIDNDGHELRTVELTTTLTGPDGAVVATDVAPVTVLPGESAVARQRVLVLDPALWHPASPTLYRCTTSLAEDGRRIDEQAVAFGIRTLQVDPERGLRINGRTVKLRGACVHHDNGVIGAATIARAEERRVELLKQAGFNAIRSAHNPVSTAMLEACDRLGMLVMDEAFDMWTAGKSSHDYALDFPTWWERDIEAMVAKDVNHPSVVLYSTGNEILEIGTPRGAELGRRIAEKIRSCDDTRFVTNGVNGGLIVMAEAVEAARESGADDVADTAPQDVGINTMMSRMTETMNRMGASELATRATAEAFAALDVAGMNYLDSRYVLDRELFPNRVIVGTETFPTRIDVLWRLVVDNPHVIGDFTWTGWDYLGEAGIGRVQYPDDLAGAGFTANYPWALAWCGDIDITGRRRPASYYREIVFGLRTRPYIAVRRPGRGNGAAGPWSWTDSVSSWSWTGHEGAPVRVEVYSDADEVELVLDGNPVPRGPAGEKNRFRAEFDLTYRPGELVAIAYRDGTESGRTTLRSASGPVRLAATVDRDAIRADDTDLAYLDIALVDAAGTVDTSARRRVRVEVSGPGMLQGLGSADPAPDEPMTGPERSTFDGRALAVVRPTGAGVITVTVAAADCANATLTITAR